jgi:hypothetical protein
MTPEDWMKVRKAFKRMAERMMELEEDLAETQRILKEHIEKGGK